MSNVRRMRRVKAVGIDRRQVVGFARLATRPWPIGSELVSLGPEVLVAGGSSAAVETLQQQTTTIPIVFVNIIGRIAFVRRIRSGCCARAAIGQLMAEPATTLMKSRRCIIAAMLRSTPDTH